MREENEFQERQYREMEYTCGEIRKLQHDMKNSFQLLYGLLAQGKTEEALDWLKQENAALAGVPDVIRMQSALIGTMLNGKLIMPEVWGCPFPQRSWLPFPESGNGICADCWGIF